MTDHAANAPATGAVNGAAEGKAGTGIDRGSRNLIVTIVLMVLYVLGIIHIGFFISSFVYLLVHMWVLGLRRPVMMVAVAVGVLCVLYGVIELFLGVPMPAELLI